MSATATERVLLDAPNLLLGHYRCAPGDPRWETRNSIGPLAHVVFPERPVTITREGIGPQLGDRNWALLYVPGQHYERRLVDPGGDECSYVALSPRLYADLLAGDRQVEPAFGAGRVLVDDQAWLGYQEVLRSLPYVGTDALEQQLLSVLREVLQLRPDVPGSALDGVEPHRSVEQDRRVHEACRILATRLDERVTLPDVAEAVGLSTYHFCRLFRAATGLTVHAYRKRLRLREAFAGCASRPDRKLAEVALSAGYASHSHMTTDFQAALAMTPSGVRDRYARGSAEAGIFNLR